MKDKFYNHVFETLANNGFNKISDLIWERTVTHQQPGQLMVINGQRFQQPGETLNYIFRVLVGEESTISNADDSHQDSFTIIDFSSFTKGNEINANGAGISFYYNELQEFDNILANWFRI